MTIGGRRTFLVPAALGFGSSTVLGPYGELLFSWVLLGTAT
jgi:FKBP-type peptidyl-prolyl cis-trans isomerase